MGKREGTTSPQDPSEYDPSQEPGYGYHPTGLPEAPPTGDGSGYGLTYGGTGGEMSGKYGNNFVNMQAYLQANSGARNVTFGHGSTTNDPFGSTGDYTSGMGQLDQALAEASKASGKYPAASGQRPAHAPDATPAPAPGPGVSSGGLPGTGPTQDPAPTQTGSQALRQGFQPPDFTAGAGNFAGMNQQMPRKQPQAGGGY